VLPSGVLARLLHWLLRFVAEVKARYGVNPWIYVGMMVACTPPFYFFLFRTLRAFAKRDTHRGFLLLGVCVVIYFLPTFYIVIFGHDLPWWIWLVLGVLAAWGIYALLRRILRARRSSR
jgi:hypothetical protein